MFLRRVVQGGRWMKNRSLLDVNEDFSDESNAEIPPQKQILLEVEILFGVLYLRPRVALRHQHRLLTLLTLDKLLLLV